MIMATKSVREQEPGVWRSMLKGIGFVMLVLCLGIALAIGVVPRVLGGAALTVLTGSMQPTYAPGDMVVATPQEQYAIGDVVVFQPVSGDPTLVTHRVVAVRASADGAQYVTRGDANTRDDDPIVAAQVMGKVRYHVPYIGHLASFLGQHRLTLLYGAGALLFGYGAVTLGLAAASKRRNAGPDELAQQEDDIALARDPQHFGG